jgi:hypothetical protein
VAKRCWSNHINPTGRIAAFWRFNCYFLGIEGPRKARAHSEFDPSLLWQIKGEILSLVESGSGRGETCSLSAIVFKRVIH